LADITLSDFELTRFLFAIVVLLASAHGFGYFFQRRLRIPRVIGEIFGGLVLGPTVLGYFLPSVHEWIFYAFESEGQLIATIYWIGLVLLMFLSGLEIQKSYNKADTRLILAILLGSTIIPFVVGWFTPKVYDFSPYLGEKGNLISATIIIAIAIAVTSIPVISKIFIDLKIIDSRFAKIVLATATIEDVILWVALAVATGLAGGEVLSVTNIVSKVLVTLAFFLIALLAFPKLFAFISKARLNLLIKSSATGYVLFVCFLFAAVASILQVNIIFGAFLAGIVVGMTSNQKIDAAKTPLKEIGLGFFIPIYFAVVGLKLDLIHHFNFQFFLAFLLFAVAIKTLGAVTAARLARQDWLSSFNLGVAMNARGGPGIVLATVAFDLGIINETFFAVLVMIAIVTSLAAGYWLRFVISRGWSLLSEEEDISIPAKVESVTSQT
jgi:Kef-type K+ transport system membrane component KefB